MAKESGKKSFLDFFKMKELDEDEFDDDLFDEDEDDDDEEDYAPVRTSKNKKTSRTNYNQTQSAYRENQNVYDNYSTRQSRQAAPQQNRVVDFSNPRPKTTVSRNEVYVMVPHDTSESQTVADFLKAGKTIVLNMAGLDTTTAQRIIDFVAGSCYALDGSLQGISDNIFIAAPSSIEVSGDLRELLNNGGAPNMYRY